jgi:phage terminase small subunit
VSLTTKQRRFVEEYIGPANFNASEAARRAGYSEKTAYSIGHENLSKPEIEAAIEKRLDELSMSAAEATKRLTEWARADPSEVIEVHEGGRWSLDLERAVETGAIRLIKELSYDSEGRPKVKLHDAKDATIQLAKIRGLYVDRVHHSGKIEGGVLMVPHTSEDEWDELAKRRQAALSQNGDGRG